MYSGGTKKGMNRTITNVIRYLMDECIPAVIRDNRYFMFPFYYYAYRGKNIKQVMNFKSLVHGFTEEEYKNFYDNLDTVSRNRKTDLNRPCLKFILGHMDREAKNILDVGCGTGYFLNQLKDTGLQLHGCDIVDKAPDRNFTFTAGDIEKLPFGDRQFDVVTCFHTIEHLLNLQQAISELKRVTKKQLIIVTPCQRYFYHTLDEHVNFFPYKEKLTSLVKIEDHSCDKIWGDWVYIGRSP